MRFGQCVSFNTPSDLCDNPAVGRPKAGRGHDAAKPLVYIYIYDKNIVIFKKILEISKDL